MNLVVPEPGCSRSWRLVLVLVMVMVFGGVEEWGLSGRGFVHSWSVEIPPQVQVVAYGGSERIPAEVVLQQQRQQCCGNMESVKSRLNAAAVPTIRVATSRRGTGVLEGEGHSIGDRRLGGVNFTAVEADVAALLAVKASLVQDAQNVLANWTVAENGADTHCRTWAGVQCDSALRVVGLSLPFSGLSGTISPMIGNLTELSNLNLSRNLLSGAIPQEMMNCQKLVALDLGQNNLVGGIPAAIAALSQLEQLILHYNNLEGDLPLALTQLEHLQVVDFQNNTFTGESS